MPQLEVACVDFAESCLVLCAGGQCLCHRWHQLLGSCKLKTRKALFQPSKHPLLHSREEQAKTSREGLVM